MIVKIDVESNNSCTHGIEKCSVSKAKQQGGLFVEYPHSNKLLDFNP